LIAGCVTGKISQVLTSPFFMGYSQTIFKIQNICEPQYVGFITISFVGLPWPLDYDYRTLWQEVLFLISCNLFNFIIHFIKTLIWKLVLISSPFL